MNPCDNHLIKFLFSSMCLALNWKAIMYIHTPWMITMTTWCKIYVIAMKIFMAHRAIFNIKDFFSKSKGLDIGIGHAKMIHPTFNFDHYATSKICNFPSTIWSSMWLLYALLTTIRSSLLPCQFDFANNNFNSTYSKKFSLKWNYCLDFETQKASISLCLLQIDELQVHHQKIVHQD